MIKRHYFMSAKIHHDDGKGSYSWRSYHFTRKSFFDESVQACAEQIELVRKEAEALGRDRSAVEFICFCRC
jgi:hypothetical protein